MKKILPRLFIITFVLLALILILSFVNSFYGNPISAAIATSEIKAYAKATYPDLDLEIPDAHYNFKYQDYSSFVKSRKSIDTSFSIQWSKGRIYDSYVYDVEQRGMTYQRLQTELNKAIVDIINRDFPYETNILFADFSKQDGDFGSLTLDMPLNIKEPALPIKITIYILTQDVSYDYLAARLTELSKLMDSNGIPVSYYDMVLQEPMPEGEKAAPGGQSNYLFDFPAEKIQSDNLIEIIKEHQKEYEQEHNKN